MSVSFKKSKDNDRRCFDNSTKLENWTGTEDHCLSSAIWISKDPWQDDFNKPQHTPKKLSKVELTSSTSALSAFELESNEKDYLIDLEKVNMSQYLGSRIENKTNGPNLNSISPCPASGILYKTVHSTPNFSNQWQRTSSCTIPSGKDKITSKCAHSFPAASNSESNLSDYLCSEELCSHSVCSQQPVLSSLNVSAHLKSTNQEYQQDTPLDPSVDQGYSSHSTGSSYQGQDSQREGSVMEQGSQMDLGTEERDWSAGIGSADGNCIDSENELEDLLYHFQNFFQDRFESEFRRYQEAVYGIIQEQQNHVRQIVHTAISEQCSSQSCPEELLSDEAKKMPGVSKSTVQPEISFTQMLDTDFYVPISVPSTLLSNSSSVVKGESVERRLLDLYSLSCSVSTLLAKRQFKS